MTPNKIFMFLITPPPAEMLNTLKLIAKHVFECLKKRKEEDKK